jgi:hypothetical protein
MAIEWWVRRRVDQERSRRLKKSGVDQPDWEGGGDLYLFYPIGTCPTQIPIYEYTLLVPLLYT